MYRRLPRVVRIWILVVAVGALIKVLLLSGTSEAQRVGAAVAAAVREATGPTPASSCSALSPAGLGQLLSEFGGEAPFGKHGKADERWTEEYQASLYQHQIEMLRKIPSLAGLSPWVLMDFHSPRRLLPGLQDYYNRKGLISNLGQRKQAFYVLQRFYRQVESTK